MLRDRRKESAVSTLGATQVMEHTSTVAAPPATVYSVIVERVGQPVPRPSARSVKLRKTPADQRRRWPAADGGPLSPSRGGWWAASPARGGRRGGPPEGALAGEGFRVREGFGVREVFRMREADAPGADAPPRRTPSAVDRRSSVMVESVTARKGVDIPRPSAVAVSDRFPAFSKPDRKAGPAAGRRSFLAARTPWSDQRPRVVVITPVEHSPSRNASGSETAFAAAEPRSQYLDMDTCAPTGSPYDTALSQLFISDSGLFVYRWLHTPPAGPCSSRPRPRVQTFLASGIPAAYRRTVTPAPAGVRRVRAPRHPLADARAAIRQACGTYRSETSRRVREYAQSRHL